MIKIEANKCDITGKYYDKIDNLQEQQKYVVSKRENYKALDIHPDIYKKIEAILENKTSIIPEIERRNKVIKALKLEKKYDETFVLDESPKLYETVKKSKNKSYRWKPNEDKILNEFKELPIKELAELLPGRSKQAIYLRIYTKKAKENRSKNQKEFIEKTFGKGRPKQEEEIIEKPIEKPIEASIKRKTKLNAWTNSEYEIMEKNYGRITIQKLQSLLPNRSVKSLHGRAQMMGLKQPFLTFEERAKLREEQKEERVKRASEYESDNEYMRHANEVKPEPPKKCKYCSDKNAMPDSDFCDECDQMFPRSS